MAPSSKSEKDEKQKTVKKHKDHVVKLIARGKVSINLQNVTYNAVPKPVLLALGTNSLFSWASY